MLQLDLVGLRHRHAAILGEPVARVDADHPALPGQAAHRFDDGRREQPETVVGNQDRVAARGRLLEGLEDFRHQRRPGCAEAVAVDADHLLPTRAAAAGENARLGGGGAILGAVHQRDVGAALAQELQEPLADRIVADDADRLDLGPQRAEVGDGVGGAARLQLGALVADDEHRRLAADAIGLAVDEFVGDQISHHGDARAGESIEQLLEVLIHAALSLSHPTQGEQ